MNQAAMLAAAALVAALFLGIGLVLLRIMRRADRLRARLAAARTHMHGKAGAATPPARSPFALVGAVGLHILRSGLLSAKTIATLENSLVSAGFRGGNGLPLFVGGKILLLLGAPLLAWVVLGHVGVRPPILYLAMAVAAVIGLLLPDSIIGKLRKRHLKRVEAGLSDALDMMVICAEAGLALEPAIGRVGVEIRAAHPSVADELLLTASEMRILETRVALVNLGGRTGLEALKRLATTLVQTLQYGTPLAQALRVLAAELRQETLTRFEARAARLPVLLTLPMILFILPCVFLVVGGPAMIQVLHAFHR